MTDARFEEGADTPLRLIAREAAGLQVLSALLQDAVFPITEMRFVPVRRRFALLLNRFRWEDRQAALQSGRPAERVRSLLVFDDVLAVRSQGIDRSQNDTVLSVLHLGFDGEEDGSGHVLLTLAGDGAIALSVDALDATLRDVTRPYLAPSGHTPDHGA